MKYKYIFQSVNTPELFFGSNNDVQAMTLDDEEWITIDCENGTVDTIVAREATDEDLGIEADGEPEEEAEDDDD